MNYSPTADEINFIGAAFKETHRPCNRVIIILWRAFSEEQAATWMRPHDESRQRFIRWFYTEDESVWS